MNRHWRVFLASALLAAAAAAGAHPATELYIPIGKSPGISNVKTRIGHIQSLAAATTGITIASQDGSTYVAFGRATKIYLQHADPGQANELGTYADCRAGLLAEAYVEDDGSVPWVKVLVP